MAKNLHFTASLNTCAAELNDGSKAVCLSFYDKETINLDIYPLSPEIAEDLGHELIRLSKVTNKL